MKYPVYSEFKTNGAGHRSQLPVTWEMRRLKFIATCNDDALSETTDPDYELAYVDISSVSLEQGITTVEAMPFEKAPSRARRLVKDGDTIVSTVRTYLKAIAAIENPPENLVVSTGFAVIRSMPNVDSRYLAYALQSTNFIEAVVAHSSGVSYPAINPSELTCLPVAYPESTDEQRHIADFLDWKTGQIDALISRKQALLDRLKEKRLAVITHAVTRGLKPDAPLRDSGISWLGKVPEHWTVKRLRFVCSRIEQGWSPQCDNIPAEDGFWGVMKVGCVNGDVFDANENKALPTELTAAEEYELQSDDILISRANTRELLGSAAVVPVGVRGKLLLCDKLFRLRPTEEIENDFLTFLLRTPFSRFQYEREATGASASMQNIGQGTIKNVIAIIPPKWEQKAICCYIRAQLNKLDSLLSTTDAVITRLAEYRTTLITAATTGKIDLRNVQIPKLTEP